MRTPDIIMCVAFIISVIGAFILCIIKKHDKQKCRCIDFLTFCLVLAAICGFLVTNYSTRMQTSMDFCLSTYQMFQSKEFVEKERFICKELKDRGDNYCAIEDIDNDTLRDAVYEYCEIMNGVGVLVQKEMIDAEVVVSYLGANTLMAFQYIKPYLDLTRDAKYHDDVLMGVPEYERELIRNSRPLTFAHFELLAMEIEKQAPKLTQKYERKLRNKKKKIEKITSVH